LWCVGGLVFTLLSYYFTEAGGRYVIATGAIVWGAIQAINGLTAYLRIMRARGENTACRKAIVIAACTALVIAGLAYQSWRMVQPENTPLIDTPQPYDCPELGVRFRVPAEFSEIVADNSEETDSTYAFYQMSAWNDRSSIMVEGTAGNLADAEIENVEEISAYLETQAREFFDAGLLGEGAFVEIGSVRMLKHVGRRTEFPDWTTVMYDLVHKGSLLTFYIHAQGMEVPEETATEFMRSVEIY
ncbi:MAG: hypothetical protein K2M66_05260, partial [Alistipes sp.]|nr:hypothetical protein [Alistipes sp.]